VVRDPGAAERHCEEEEDDFDAVSSLMRASKCPFTPGSFGAFVLELFPPLARFV